MNKMRTEFISISKNESFARSVAAAFVLELDPTLEELSEVKTAVSEAVTNAIIHGYGSETGIITLEGFSDNKRVEFVVSDKGKGIKDVDKAMEAMYSESDDDERSGLGFTIMESFMDEISVKSVPGCGTVVRMSKKIGR